MKKSLIFFLVLVGLQCTVTLFGQDLDYYGMCKGLCEGANCPKSALYNNKCVDPEVLKKCADSCARLKEPGYWQQQKERIEKAFEEMVGTPTPEQ